MQFISAIVPLYNEEAAVAQTIERLRNALQKTNIPFEIIAVNDASTDSSGKILEKIKDIMIITNPYNLGYGASIKKGMRKAQGDWIAITDADGTYPVEDLSKFTKYADKF